MPKEKPTPAKHTVNTEPSQSLLSKMFTPLTDFPSRMASDFVRDTSARPDENVWLARAKGMAQGMAQGAGDLMSDMTSPASLAAAYIPGVMGMRRSGRAYQTMREAAMPRINPNPPAVNTFDLVMPQRATAGIDVGPRVGRAIAPDYVNTPSEFNTADDVFEHYYKNSVANRGTAADVPNNSVAQNLERERRAITDRRGSGNPESPTRRKLFDKTYDSRYNKSERRGSGKRDIPPGKYMKKKKNSGDK